MDVGHGIDQRAVEIEDHRQMREIHPDLAQIAASAALRMARMFSP